MEVPVYPRRIYPEGVRLIRRYLIPIVLCIIVVFILSLSVGSVGVGEASVIVDPLTGGVSGPVVGPRWFLKAPWQYYRIAYIALDKVDMWTDPATGTMGDFPTVSCLTSDGLTADVDVSIRWSVDAQRLLDLYRSYPFMDWKSRTVIPVARKVIRDVTVKYKAIDTITMRQDISAAMHGELIETLSGIESLANAISIESVDVRRIELPSRFKDAIESKLREEQLMIAADFNRTKILILANATAQAEILQAYGKAQARMIEANATAEAMSVIAGYVGTNSTDVASLYLSLTLLKDVAATGKNVYVIVSPEKVPIIIPGTAQGSDER